MKLNFFKIISEITGLGDEDLKNLILKNGNKYKKFYIPKKNGNQRAVFHPRRELKLIQYAVLAGVLQDFKESSIAKAYITGDKSPIRKIALEHVNFRYTIRIDFKDFFPSIVPDDFIPLLRERFQIYDDELSFIEKIFFLKYKGSYMLPIGAPTSPKVSNLVMCKLDVVLRECALQIDSKSSISRYADDLYFSTNIKGACADFLKKTNEIIQQTESPSLTINNDKTLFLSKGTKRTVCGIFVTPDGKISLGKKRKEFIKRQLYLFNKQGLNEDEINQTIGLLAFCKDCDHLFYNTVIKKYGAGILSNKFSP